MFHKVGLYIPSIFLAFSRTKKLLNVAVWELEMTMQGKMIKSVESKKKFEFVKMWFLGSNLILIKNLYRWENFCKVKIEIVEPK